jgi:putative Ca2+/H+ antiporter (TMEM165/GDT1 family)
VAGSLLGTRLPERATRFGAAALFALFGLLLLLEAARA